MMRLSISQLRSIIQEALVDKMRFPRGPNSRDDADDRGLDDPMKDRFNEEEDASHPDGLV